MIDDADLGRRLADEVIARVVQRYPSVSAAVLETVGYHGTLVSFEPANTEGAPIWFYANFDWSFQLESQGLIWIEDLPMDESERDRVSRVVSEIFRVAESGLQNHRPRRERVGAWT